MKVTKLFCNQRRLFELFVSSQEWLTRELNIIIDVEGSVYCEKYFDVTKLFITHRRVCQQFEIVRK